MKKIKSILDARAFAVLDSNASRTYRWCKY